MGYLYIIIEREFINLHRKVYKIGKCFEISVRKFGYPKGSVLVVCYYVENPLAIEQLVMSALKSNSAILQELNIGREYFSGNIGLIKSIIHEIVLKHESDYDFVIKNGNHSSSNKSLYDILAEKFKFTYDDRDHTPYSELEKYVIDEKKLQISPKKLSLELTALGFKPGKKYINSQKTALG